MFAYLLLISSFILSSFALGMDGERRAQTQCDPCRLLDEMVKMGPGKVKQNSDISFKERMTTDTNGTHKYNQDIIRLSIACERGYELKPGSKVGKYSFVDRD